MDVGQFARRLRELRENAGLTQARLAARAGLSQRAISFWELGLREPSWGNVVALAAALGTDCRAFLQEPVGGPVAPRRGRPPKKEQATPAKAAQGKPAKGQAKGR